MQLLGRAHLEVDKVMQRSTTLATYGEASDLGHCQWIVVEAQHEVEALRLFTRRGPLPNGGTDCVGLTFFCSRFARETLGRSRTKTSRGIADLFSTTTTKTAPAARTEAAA